MQINHTAISSCGSICDAPPPSYYLLVQVVVCTQFSVLRRRFNLRPLGGVRQVTAITACHVGKSSPAVFWCASEKCGPVHDWSVAPVI
jgi:hypothetical protein